MGQPPAQTRKHIGAPLFGQQLVEHQQIRLGLVKGKLKLAGMAQVTGRPAPLGELAQEQGSQLSIVVEDPNRFGHVDQSGGSAMTCVWGLGPRDLCLAPLINSH